jgi:hypothetical protein
MAKAARLIGAVLAGAAVWAVLWIGGTKAAQAAFPGALTPGQPLVHGGALLGLILYSVGLSLLAGYVTAAAAGPRPLPAVGTLAALQLTLGIIAEASYWSLMPVWYHLVFLALVVPATVYGGALRARRRPFRTIAT